MLITVILTIIAIIVAIHFGIKSSNKTHEDIKDTRKAGVIDEGIGSAYINCEGIGQDAGLIGKGKKLTSIDSKWSTRDDIVEKQRLMFEKNEKNQYKNSAK